MKAQARRQVLAQDQLGRTAVPDAGGKLEELLIRMKRPVGMSVSERANQVHVPGKPQRLRLLRWDLP